MAYGALFSTKLIGDGRYGEAVETATREIASGPSDPEPYFNRARALAGLERWEEAVRDYGHALREELDASAVDPAEIDDELFFALRQWAVVQRDQHQDVERALAILESYTAICPDGRHTGDLDTWRNHLRGIEETWVRERV